MEVKTSVNIKEGSCINLVITKDILNEIFENKDIEKTYYKCNQFIIGKGTFVATTKGCVKVEHLGISDKIKSFDSVSKIKKIDKKVLEIGLVEVGVENNRVFFLENDKRVLVKDEIKGHIWKEVENLKQEDYIGTDLNTIEKNVDNKINNIVVNRFKNEIVDIDYTDELVWIFFGLYLKSGVVVKHDDGDKVVFKIHKERYKDINNVNKFIKRYFKEAEVYAYKRNEYLNICILDKLLILYLNKNLGSSNKGKRIPMEFRNAPKKYLELLLRNAIDFRNGQILLYNKYLAYAYRESLAKIYGKYYGVNHILIKEKINRLGVYRNNTYYILSTTPQKDSYVEDDVLWVKVNNISYKRIQKVFFNVEIDNNSQSIIYNGLYVK